MAWGGGFLLNTILDDTEKVLAWDLDVDQAAYSKQHKKHYAWLPHLACGYTSPPRVAPESCWLTLSLY